MTAVSSSVIWAPLPGSQQLVLTCPCDELLYEGERGPGKTDALLMDFAQHVGKGYGSYWRGVIFRREYKHLEDIIVRSKRWFRQIFPRARFLASKGDYKWVFPDGEELLFRAFKVEDDYWDYHGHEYPFIGWEELTSWPDLKCYDSIKSCNRSSFQPQPGQLPIPLKIRATTNPYGRGHNAVKKYFIIPAPAGVPILENGRTRVRIFGAMRENPFLTPDYVNTIESVKDPNKRRAWRYGSWDITSGGMLDDLWNERVHVIPPFEIPFGWRIKRTLDWGFSKPFSVGWWAQSNGDPVKLSGDKKKFYPRGTWFRIAEWYGSTGGENEGLRLTARKVAEGIKERETQFPWGSRIKPGAADSSIFNTDDSTSVADNMASVGVKWTEADKRPGSRKAGADKIRELLEASLVKPMESPGLFIFNTCRKWIELVPIIPRSEDDPDDVDCWIAGTMIATSRGDKPIEAVRIGDLVQTPIGLRPVVKSYDSGVSAVVTARLSDGRTLTGTPNHKVMVSGVGLVELAQLQPGQILEGKNTWSEWLNIEALPTVNTLIERTTRRISGLFSLAERHCIGRFGLITTGQSQTDSTCTTGMAMRKITPLKTWNSLALQTMQDCILQSEPTTSRALRPNGSKMAGAKFSAKMLRKCLMEHPKGNLRAAIVAFRLSRNTTARSIALSALQNSRPRDNKKRTALSVVQNFISNLIAPSRYRAVVISVGGCSEKQSVFNLTVEQAHMFYANGVLSSNTESEDHNYDETRYAVTERAKTSTIRELSL